MKLQRPVVLTRSDWLEIVSALQSKELSLRRGEYGADEEPGSTRKWIRHLRQIQAAIGPDGTIAAKYGVAPIRK